MLHENNERTTNFYWIESQTLIQALNSFKNSEDMKVEYFTNEYVDEQINWLKDTISICEVTVKAGISENPCVTSSINGKQARLFQLAVAAYNENDFPKTDEDCDLMFFCQANDQILNYLEEEEYQDNE